MTAPLDQKTQNHHRQKYWTLADTLRGFCTNMPTAKQLRALRLELEGIEGVVTTAERRAAQAAELHREPEKHVDWLGSIDQFAADLVYHAERLDRIVRGRFNDVVLVAQPDSTVENVFVQYDVARFGPLKGAGQ